MRITGPLSANIVLVNKCEPTVCILRRLIRETAFSLTCTDHCPIAHFPLRGLDITIHPVHGLPRCSALLRASVDRPSYMTVDERILDLPSGKASSMLSTPHSDMIMESSQHHRAPQTTLVSQPSRILPRTDTYIAQRIHVRNRLAAGHENKASG